MTEAGTILPLIQTKLHRPPAVAGLVPRAHLVERLENGRGRPLTLVSAPAGYGKSTLVVSWLEVCDCPSTWISLDENDNDLRLFLSYLLAAVRKLFPGACGQTEVLVNAAELPPARVVAGSLINGLDEIPEPFIIVLDDYHLIDAAPVHDLMGELLQYPPRPLHLVVIARKDPPLPISALRARSQANEIRTRDLRFTPVETKQFLEQALNLPVDDDASKALGQKTEGWVTGLRLAVLSSRSHDDLGRTDLGFLGDNPMTADYVAEEVLSKLPPSVHRFLMATAVPTRFCASLCETLCAALDETRPMEHDGHWFVDWIVNANLFVIPLDVRNRWYRYHHLFQQILVQRLETHWGRNVVNRQHRTASQWFEENGFVEEAIYHAGKCGAPQEIGRLIARHQSDLLNHEQWARLSSWLQRLPADLVDNDAELQLLSAWSLDNRVRLEEAWQALDRAESLRLAMPPKAARADRLMGGIHALRSRQSHENTDGTAAVAHAEKALTLLPEVCQNERGFAIGLMAAGFLLMGQLARALDVIHGTLKDERLPRGILQARLLAILCYLNWMEMDMPALKLTAAEYMALGDEAGLMESRAGGRYFLGIAQYLCNDLDAAESTLGPMLEDRFLLASTAGSVQGAFALSAVYQARGQEEKASTTLRTVAEHMFRIRNLPMLALVRAHAADLQLHQGRIAEALKWAENFDPEPLTPMYRFCAPQMTLARVLLAEGSDDRLRRAEELLDRLTVYLTRTHNRRFLVEALAMKAMVAHRLKDDAEAAETLTQALTLATPGGGIRVFVDLGPACLKLMSRLDLDADATAFAGRAILAYQPSARSSHTVAQKPHIDAPSEYLVDPLSAREKEILQLLARRLSNAEIAERLFISPKTVKAHLYNIYQKLHVGSRRKAVVKARALGMIQDI